MFLQQSTSPLLYCQLKTKNKGCWKVRMVILTNRHLQNYAPKWLIVLKWLCSVQYEAPSKDLDVMYHVQNGALMGVVLWADVHRGVRIKDWGSLPPPPGCRRNETICETTWTSLPRGKGGNTLAPVRLSSSPVLVRERVVTTLTRKLLPIRHLKGTASFFSCLWSPAEIIFFLRGDRGEGPGGELPKNGTLVAVTLRKQNSNYLWAQ